MCLVNYGLINFGIMYKVGYGYRLSTGNTECRPTLHIQWTFLERISNDDGIAIVEKQASFTVYKKTMA